MSISISNAQNWGGGGAANSMSKVGHFYGKVVDSITGKGIPFVAVQLSGPKWDSASQSVKNQVVAGQLTGDHGEFSLSKLPVSGQFLLQFNSIGYKPYQKTVSFDLRKMMKRKSNIQGSDNSGNPMSSMESMINAIDKDLGNIRLQPNSSQLKQVTINGEAPPMELKLDKRVFDVSKSITTTGGTAEDVLKNIPAINVDIDGNVTLRNASPTIYVDGLPTTLTIDQIPADEIDKVEVITNPSAKYDASAGTGGIINIIMKHNKTVGYNGSVRGGVDGYGKMNLGLDLNLRQGKFNVFGDVFFKQIEHKMYGSSSKDTIGVTLRNPETPWMDIMQHDTNTVSGYFGFVRAGFDYFIDNRNTLTLTGTYGTGHINSLDLQHTSTDTLPSTVLNNSSTFANSSSQRIFHHDGLSLLYKHLFPKEDENLTASISEEQGQMTSSSNIDITDYNSDFVPYTYVLENQQSAAINNNLIFKTDFTDPLTKKIKLDVGAMVTAVQSNSSTNIFINNILLNRESNVFDYNEQIYATYLSYSQELTSRISFQAAVRFEQSMYSGILSDTTSSISLPVQSYFYLFPSSFLTYHLSDKSDLQLSYTTHINRPSFGQLVINNYSNPENIQLANPNLTPSYMNSFEMNYLTQFNKRNSLLVSAYYKVSNNIITNQLLSQSFNPELNQIQYSSTYANANYAYSEGLELTSQNSISDWFDITANINFFESGINATNLNVPDTAKPFLSYFAKLNLTFKLPLNFSIQINSNYLSKTQVPPGGVGGGRWGGYGGGGYGGIIPSAEGYILPDYWIDAALKKDFFKNKKASLTFSVKDIFATAYNNTDMLATDPSGTPLYYQTTSRIRDPRYYQITFSYRFGQTDFSLFKRKNNNTPDDQGQGMGTGE